MKHSYEKREIVTCLYYFCFLDGEDYLRNQTKILSGTKMHKKDKATTLTFAAQLVLRSPL